MEQIGNTAATELPFGRRYKQFSTIIGMSPAWLYALPKDQQPKSVKVGGARIVIEQPDEFLKRVGRAA